MRTSYLAKPDLMLERGRRDCQNACVFWSACSGSWPIITVIPMSPGDLHKATFCDGAPIPHSEAAQGRDIEILPGRLNLRVDHCRLPVLCARHRPDQYWQSMQRLLAFHNHCLATAAVLSVCCCLGIPRRAAFDRLP